MAQYRTFPISIAMDAETLDKLEQLVQQRDSNRSETIRDLICKEARRIETRATVEMTVPSEVPA